MNKQAPLQMARHIFSAISKDSPIKIHVDSLIDEVEPVRYFILSED